MGKKPSSLEIYNKILREIGANRKKLTMKHIESLLETMKAELVISGYSALLDAFYNECINYCSTQKIAMFKFETKNYYFTEMRNSTAFPKFDFCHFPIFLSNYMNGNLSSINKENILKYFLNNYAPSNPEKWCLCLLQAFKTIDFLVVELRQKMYTCMSEKGIESKSIFQEKFIITELSKKEIDSSVKTLMIDADDERNNIIVQVRRQAESEAREIIESARKQAESEKQGLLDTAQSQANRIIYNASVIAERKIAEAKKRVLEFSADKRLDKHTIEQGITEQYFFAVREELVKANESIKNLEDSVSISITKKAYTQLIELYNLIADTKDSTISLALQMNSQDLESAAYNMDVFLDMLVEYLADYGVQTIASFQGDAFSVKHHTLGRTNIQFDPRNAYISRSLRNGFLWGEQVLQKELVEIEGDEYVSRY